MHEPDTLTAEELATARQVAGLSYRNPSRDLTRDIMTAIRPARSGWSRALRWLLTPRTVRIAPFWPATVLTALALVLIFVPLGHRNTPEAVSPLSSDAPVRVVFSYPESRAHTVAVIGSFNGWQHPGYSMSRDAGGTWTVSIMVPRGRYEYAFIIDGTRIISDPSSLLHRDDGFGNINSILMVDDHAIHHTL